MVSETKVTHPHPPRADCHPDWMQGEDKPDSYGGNLVPPSVIPSKSFWEGDRRKGRILTPRARYLTRAISVWRRWDLPTWRMLFPHRARSHVPIRFPAENSQSAISEFRDIRLLPPKRLIQSCADSNAIWNSRTPRHHHHPPSPPPRSGRLRRVVRRSR